MLQNKILNHQIMTQKSDFHKSCRGKILGKGCIVACVLDAIYDVLQYALEVRNKEKNFYMSRLRRRFHLAPKVLIFIPPRKNNLILPVFDSTSKMRDKYVLDIMPKVWNAINSPPFCNQYANYDSDLYKKASLVPKGSDIRLAEKIWTKQYESMSKKDALDHIKRGIEQNYSTYGKFRMIFGESPFIGDRNDLNIAIHGLESTLKHCEIWVDVNIITRLLNRIRESIDITPI